MKKLKLMLVICVTIALLDSCQKDENNPSCNTVCQNGGTLNTNCGCNCPSGFTGSNCQTPVAPSIPNCEKYHTSTVTFKNNSASHYTYDIIWDGSKIATLSYQTVSTAFTVAAGQHTLAWKITGTNSYGCTGSNPVLIECYSGTFSCSY